mgnify:CR=1 FL=1
MLEGKEPDMATFTDVFERKEVKYRLSARQAEEMRRALAGRLAPDEYGRTSVRSLYLDTPERALIERSLDKPLYKEKLRLRSYGAPTGDGLVRGGSCVFGRRALRGGLRALPAGRPDGCGRVVRAAQPADCGRDRPVYDLACAACAVHAHPVRACGLRARARRALGPAACRCAVRPAHHVRRVRRLPRFVCSACGSHQRIRACAFSSSPRRRVRHGDQGLGLLPAVARGRARCVPRLPNVVLQVRRGVPRMHERSGRRVGDRAAGSRSFCDCARGRTGSACARSRRPEGRLPCGDFARWPSAPLSSNDFGEEGRLLCLIRR